AVGAGVAGQADLPDVRQQGIEQFVGTAVAAVLTGIVLQRLAGSGIDVVAGQEVGDADREADDVAAFGLELLGLFGHHHDRTGLGTAHALGELGHRGNLGSLGSGGCGMARRRGPARAVQPPDFSTPPARSRPSRSEEHTSELQSRETLVCRLLLEKKKSMAYE